MRIKWYFINDNRYWVDKKFRLYKKKWQNSQKYIDKCSGDSGGPLFLKKNGIYIQVDFYHEDFM